MYKSTILQYKIEQIYPRKARPKPELNNRVSRLNNRPYQFLKFRTHNLTPRQIHGY